MTIRETAIAKIQQLPESLVQKIIDFIDFIARNYQVKTASYSIEGDRSEAWARWFEATDGLEITPEITSTVPTSEYQQRLLHPNSSTSCLFSPPIPKPSNYCAIAPSMTPMSNCENGRKNN